MNTKYSHHIINIILVTTPQSTVKDEHSAPRKCFIKTRAGSIKVKGMTFWCISARNCKYEVLH